MGNGNEKLKFVADFVNKKSSEDGVAFELKKVWGNLTAKSM
jgi:hydroxymethylpyrimidine pyrophosphatase-like HAD family hydrolase